MKFRHFLEHMNFFSVNAGNARHNEISMVSAQKTDLGKRQEISRFPAVENSPISLGKISYAGA
jgi:hypothetical protein